MASEVRNAPALLIMILFTQCAVIDPPGPATVYPEYADEVEVTIAGYSLDAMEPFITRDGSYLFFNSLNNGTTTSLYYARRVSDTSFNFVGEIGNVNGSVPHLDAVASMDGSNTFYYISTRNWPTVLENLQSGTFATGTVTSIGPVAGDFYISGGDWIIMDAEISGDGNLLYYVNARFAGQPLPEESRLGIAGKNGSSFNKIPSSDSVLANSNDSTFLVYAPSISADGRELYFTRLKKGTTMPEICVSVRTDATGPFSAPKKLEISGDAVEAPSLTADGMLMYYHKKTAGDGKYHVFMMRKK